jgi:RNA polymerase sigma-70 factor (ECF subfamily)
VTRILAALPPRCRQAFVLHRFEELDYSTIARRMKLSERMVRTYVVRALLFCRARLDASSTANSDDE